MFLKNCWSNLVIVNTSTKFYVKFLRVHCSNSSHVIKHFAQLWYLPVFVYNHTFTDLIIAWLMPNIHAWRYLKSSCLRINLQLVQIYLVWTRARCSCSTTQFHYLCLPRVIIFLGALQFFFSINSSITLPSNLIALYASISIPLYYFSTLFGHFVDFVLPIAVPYFACPVTLT